MLRIMLKKQSLRIALLILAISFACSWVGVFKFGWRYVDVIGLNAAPFDASSSMVVYMGLIAIFLTPVMAIIGFFTSGER